MLSRLQRRPQGVRNKDPVLQLKYRPALSPFVPDTEIVSGKIGPPDFSWRIEDLRGRSLLVSRLATYRITDRHLRQKVGGYSVFLEICSGRNLVVSLLFYIWTLKMGGPLFNFNGFFFFGVQLLALMVMAALVLDGFNITARPAVAIILCALIPTSMFAARDEFKMGGRESLLPTVSMLLSHLISAQSTSFYMGRLAAGAGCGLSDGTRGPSILSG